MKELITVRSNPYFTQKEDSGAFSLQAHLELIIVFTDGKEYQLKKDSLNSSYKISETRLIVNAEKLTTLITELQLHQKKLESYRHNSDQINSLINHISTENK